MQHGLADARSAGAELGRPAFLALETEMFLRSAQCDRALGVLNEALQVAQSRNELFYQAELYRLQGELAIRMGATQDRGMESFQRSLECARAQRSVTFELRALTSILSQADASQRGTPAARLAELLPETAADFVRRDVSEAKKILEEQSKEGPV